MAAFADQRLRASILNGTLVITSVGSGAMDIASAVSGSDVTGNGIFDLEMVLWNLPS